MNRGIGLRAFRLPNHGPTPACVWHAVSPRSWLPSGLLHSVARLYGVQLMQRNARALAAHYAKFGNWWKANNAVYSERQ